MSFIQPMTTFIYNALSYPFSKKYNSAFMPSLQTIDETAAIASVRSYLTSLQYLATSYRAQLQVLDTAFYMSDDKRIIGKEAHENYDKLRCKMLMEFAKWDNQLLDRGPTSKHWDVLRNDVIATPSGLFIHAMSVR
jgi:hypothetical protein